MPGRPRAGRLAHRRTLTALNLYELCTGHCCFVGEDLSAAELAPAWQSVRQPLLAWYAETVPGCRPWAWWICDASAPRQCLAGQHVCPGRDEYITQHHRGRLYYGTPGVYACFQCWEECYESQARYLRRLALLLPQEEVKVPQDLADCDAWWQQHYAEAHPDPWTRGDAFAACEEFLSTQGIRA
jgi:hypothetical protein